MCASQFSPKRISIGENLIFRIIINFISIHSYTFGVFLKFYASGRGTTYYTQQVLHNPAASALTLAASLQSGFVWGRQNRTRRSVCGRINHGDADYVSVCWSGVWESLIDSQLPG